MNLHVPPELEAKLTRLAAETGRTGARWRSTLWPLNSLRILSQTEVLAKVAVPPSVVPRANLLTARLEAHSSDDFERRS